MGVVWHGNYAVYFEDARELFGKKYHLEYMRMYDEGFFAPLVELKLNYKRPVRYEDKVKVRCTYRATESAKIIFDYEIINLETGDVMVTGTSVQVFLDKNFKLSWRVPDFYEAWKNKWEAELR